MTDPVKYDDVDWHVDGALEASQPEENAAAHIGLYLAWLIRRHMHSAEFLPDEWVEAVKNGAMYGTAALSGADNKLMSDLMTAEGAAFTDWYYPNYLDDFATTFPDQPDYAVVEDSTSQARMEPVLDVRFREWVEAGRPVSSRLSTDELPTDPARLLQGLVLTLPPRETWDSFSADSRSALDQQVSQAQAMGWKVQEPPPPPHEAPELEALIPAGITAAPMQLRSVTASQWGQAVLNRSLKRLGISPRNVFVASGMGSVGGKPAGGTLTVILYSVPGASAATLDEEFRMVLKKPRGFLAREEDREVGGRQVHWELGPPWVGAWWAADGLVIQTSAPDDATLEQLVRRLP